MQNPASSSVLVLGKAVQVIKACHRLGHGLSLGQIARHVDLPRSTVQRIVQTLVAEGFLSADGGARSITLGPDLLAMGALAANDVVETSRSLLKRLTLETGETVDLARLSRDHMAFVNQVAGAQRLQAVSAVGDRFPLHCTANGKAALALLSAEEVRDLVRGRLAAHTPKTITDIDALLRELDRTRLSGIAVDLEEHTLGICALGMAFRDKAHQIYAVSMPIPSVRFAEKRGTCEAALRDTVDRLTTLL